MERLKAAAQAGDNDAMYASYSPFKTSINLRSVERLNAAAQAGDIDGLYALIREDAFVLEHIDKVPFVDTPLHIAASSRQTDFAMEMVTLMPSYATKLNQDGFSPMHLALNNVNTHLVLRLVDRDENLIRVKGRNGMTPLHYAAKQGNLDALAKFLVSCPQSITDVTIQGETALHIALKENKDEAFQVLVGWIRRTIHKDARDFEDLILNWRDNRSDSVLHIAARNGQAEVVKMLLDSRLIEVNNRDTNNETALDIAKQSDNMEITNMFRRHAMLPSKRVEIFPVTKQLKPKISYCEKLQIFYTRLIESMSSDTRDALLVVFALVATENIEALVSQPGELWRSQREDTNSPSPGILPHLIDTQYSLKEAASAPASLGKVIMNDQSFSLLWSLNTLTLVTTFGLILSLFPRGLKGPLFMPLLMMYICYAIASSLVSGTPGIGYSILLVAVYLMAWFWVSIHLGRVKRLPGEWRSSNFI